MSPAPDPPDSGEQKLRIVFLCRALSIGGAERQLVLLARGLARRGHLVTIITFYRDGTFTADAEDVEVVDLDKSGRYDTIGPLLRLRRELARRKPDILHAYLPVANLLSLIAHTLRPRPKIVWGLRDSDMRPREYDRLSRLAYGLERRLSPLADLAIANSHSGAHAAQARGLRAKQLCVILNSVELDRFLPDRAARAELRGALGLADEVPLIGHFARLDPMKDHETFLQAIRTLASRLKTAVLCVASGKETQIARLDQRIDALGLAGIVRRLPPTATPERLFPACDLYCVSSQYGEACPNVVLEAMACGVPCVVTDVGDAATLVGDLGGVAAPGDPGALADELERMIRRVATGAAPSAETLRRRATEFSPDRLANATEQVLAELRRTTMRHNE